MIARMVYVACDGCGSPASDVADDAKEARELVPRSWARVYSTDRGRNVDLCPSCAAG